MIDFDKMSVQEIAQKTANGNLGASLYTLISNSRAQFMSILQRVNPLFFKTYSDELKKMDNSKLVNFLLLQIKAGNITLYMDTQNEVFLPDETQTKRGGKILNIIKRMTEFNN